MSIKSASGLIIGSARAAGFSARPRGFAYPIGGNPGRLPVLTADFLVIAGGGGGGRTQAGGGGAGECAGATAGQTGGPGAGGRPAGGGAAGGRRDPSAGFPGRGRRRAAR